MFRYFRIISSEEIDGFVDRKPKYSDDEQCREEEAQTGCNLGLPFDVELGRLRREQVHAVKDFLSPGSYHLNN
jgi:hypothetical protein